jgi:hypothetical protein
LGGGADCCCFLLFCCFVCCRSYSIADNPEYKVAISAQMTAENSKTHVHKALGKAKLGVKLKMEAFGMHVGGGAGGGGGGGPSLYSVAENKLEEGGHAK